MTDQLHIYDVVVVGGGVAGLTAAMSAAEAGARVALLERSTEAETGGNTRYTEAFLRMRPHWRRSAAARCTEPITWSTPTTSRSSLPGHPRPCGG
jgi:flavin-dependent dehydrogenase